MPTARAAGTEDLRLPKPPGFIRAYFNRHPWLLDGLIAGGYAVPMGALAMVTFISSLFGYSPFSTGEGAGTFRETPAFGVVLLYATAAVTVALLFRRHVPVLTAAICAGSILLTSPGTQQLEGMSMAFALYALAVYRSTRSAWLWAAIGTGAGVLAVVLNDPFDLAAIIGYGVLFAGLMTIATLVGITFGNRRRYIQALLDRAAQLARERDQRALLAAASERARIAREMHDIVAHSLTVIVALSDGAEAAIERSPESAREAVRQTGITARRALTDMRRSLGVLTEPEEAAATRRESGGSEATRRDSGRVGAELAPQPGMDDVAEMVRSYRAAGLPVRFTTQGDWPADPVLQLAVFRVVQEALTNALRYAAQATRVDVVLRFEATGVQIEVTDDGVDPDRGAS
ncbi:MAG: histidine kinase, partial [Herbiconiux sp.]|nr:histidine kinase [Herbiconiux sp.]